LKYISISACILKHVLPLSFILTFESMAFDIEDETVLTPNEIAEKKKKKRET
jgi:hypothetical protein